jgi:hypothetical protein
MRSKLSARSFLKNIENVLYKKMWIYNFTVTIVSQNISRTFFVQNSIPYKTYVREKHVESILGTHKNWQIIILFLQSNSLTITIVSQKYQDLLQPNSHNRFSKISRTFYASRKLWIIVVFLLRTLEEKLPIFLINTLLLHIPLLALTDGQNYRETNTLTARGLEELFFKLCCCVSFWFWREIGFSFIYYVLMYLEYNTVVVLC